MTEQLDRFLCVPGRLGAGSGLRLLWAFVVFLLLAPVSLVRFAADRARAATKDDAIALWSIWLLDRVKVSRTGCA